MKKSNKDVKEEKIVLGKRTAISYGVLCAFAGGVCSSLIFGYIIDIVLDASGKVVYDALLYSLPITFLIICFVLIIFVGIANLDKKSKEKIKNTKKATN